MKDKEIINAIVHEVRCPNCNKLLCKFKGWGNYVLELHCIRCKNTIQISKIEKATKK